MKRFLCWLAYIVGLVAGASLAQGNSGLVQICILVGMVLWMIVDLVDNKTPNQPAVVIAIILPSLVLKMDGKGAKAIADIYGKISDFAVAPLNSWLGTNSALVLAMACIMIVFVLSHKNVLAGGRGGGGFGGR